MDYFVSDESFHSTELDLPVAVVMVLSEEFIIDHGVPQGEGVIVSLVI